MTDENKELTATLEFRRTKGDVRQMDLALPPRLADFWLAFNGLPDARGFRVNQDFLVFLWDDSYWAIHLGPLWECTAAAGLMGDPRYATLFGRHPGSCLLTSTLVGSCLRGVRDGRVWSLDLITDERVELATVDGDCGCYYEAGPDSALLVHAKGRHLFTSELVFSSCTMTTDEKTVDTRRAQPPPTPCVVDMPWGRLLLFHDTMRLGVYGAASCSWQWDKLVDIADDFGDAQGQAAWNVLSADVAVFSVGKRHTLVHLSSRPSLDARCLVRHEVVTNVNLLDLAPRTTSFGSDIEPTVISASKAVDAPPCDSSQPPHDCWRPALTCLENLKFDKDPWGDDLVIPPVDSCSRTNKLVGVVEALAETRAVLLDPLMANLHAMTPQLMAELEEGVDKLARLASATQQAGKIITKLSERIDARVEETTRLVEENQRLAQSLLRGMTTYLSDRVILADLDECVLPSLRFALCTGAVFPELLHDDLCSMDDRALLDTTAYLAKRDNHTDSSADCVDPPCLRSAAEPFQRERQGLARRLRALTMTN